MKDVTSNEHLRGKWNANERLRRHARAPGICQRMKYFYKDQVVISKAEVWAQAGKEEEEGRSLLNSISNVELLREYGINIESENEV